jgi:hypothetical protein
MTIRILSLILLYSTISCSKAPSKGESMAELTRKQARLTPVSITSDISSLNEGDKKAMLKLIEASRFLDPLFLKQVWKGNLALLKTLEADNSALGKAKLRFFKLNAGPWSRLDHNEAFIENVPKKPLGAGFYPEDMTKEEFENWTKSLSQKDQKNATGFFSVIHRTQDKKLTQVPYSEEYKEYLIPAAKLLKEAADLTSNASLKKFLTLRADALLSDDYYASDVAWMDLDAPLEITFGPYETYEDELFNYKACFESYVTIRDDQETKNLEKYSSQLQDIENHLPFADQYKNPKLGASAPIRVVDQVFSSGEGRRGVMTAAFNLPNDEKVIKEKGSKRVMLKNVQQAKFEKVLSPISKVVLSNQDLKAVAFEPFFTHILMHELMHGLGPHNIKVDGKETTVRFQLKELYSAIEEAKADIMGLWAMQYLMDKKVIDSKMQQSMYTTFLTSAFRSVRFGLNEAHGKGQALQFNYLIDKGAIRYDQKAAKFRIVPEKIKDAVRDLTGEILTLQAEGSYAKAKAMLDKYGVIRPPMQKALDALKEVPIDIEAIYPLAGE